MTHSNDRILWIDCLGGLIVGCAVIACHQVLSDWENLPIRIVIGMGVANVLYGSYSLYVTTRRSRSIGLIQLLAIANMSWLFVCIGIAASHWPEISAFGLLHVIGEGAYVAGLGYTEWRLQKTLADAQTDISG